MYKIKKTKTVLLLLIFCLAFVFLSCKKEKTESVTIFYNNDQQAYLDPCGCRVTPIGGMYRRYNAMSAVPQEYRLFLDAGNLFFSSSNIPEFLVPERSEKAKGVLEAYNLLHADALAVGSLDLALGLAELKKLEAKAKFKFLSANIQQKKDKKKPFTSYAIFEKRGKKIGVFAIFNPTLPLPADLEATDPIAAAKEQVKTLESKSVDQIIALSHQGYKEDEKLAESVKGIDLIIGAHSQSLLQSPRFHKDTRIVQLSSRGQILGRIDYELKNRKEQKVTKAEVVELDTRFDKLPPKVENPMKPLIAAINLKIQKANNEQEIKLWEKNKGDVDF